MRPRLSVCLLAACAALASIAPAAAAPEPEATSPTWSASCRLEGDPFEVRFESASDDAWNDDMQATFSVAGRIAMTIPVSPARYRSLPQLGLPDSLCQGLLAVPAGDSRVVLILPLDMRPSSESISVVLLDLSAGRVLAMKERGGQLRDSTLVTRIAGTHAIELRAVRESLPGAQCDCAQALIEDWLRISFPRGRLLIGWR